MTKQKSIVFTTKSMEVIEKYMQSHPDVRFNKVVNTIIEQHEKVKNFKQYMQDIQEIKEAIKNIEGYVIK